MALRYTLITDGSSDRALIPILTWLLRANGITDAIQPEWAELRRFRQSNKLPDRINLCLQYYPCDLLFIHRDAEGETREKRVAEINNAIKEIPPHSLKPAVCVVPVRMQEAWLLFDEVAIKHAAGNRSYRESLNLPPIHQLEKHPDPKTLLHELLKKASNLNKRRLKKFRPHNHVGKIPEFINDFSPLRKLSAFIALENDLKQILEEMNW